MLLLDDRNYIRLERAVSLTRSGRVFHYANFEQRIDAKRVRMGLFRDYPLTENLPVDLRLEVKSGKVRALARNSGQPWHEMGTAEIDLEAASLVGVSGVNTSRRPVEVTFRRFRSLPCILVACSAWPIAELGLVAIFRFFAAMLAIILSSALIYATFAGPLIAFVHFANFPTVRNQTAQQVRLD